MMPVFITAIALTLIVSALCSLLEAFILSCTVAEIEALKRRHPYIGSLLEKFKLELDETSSSILTLNTIANTAGATVVGALAVMVLPDKFVVWVSVGMVLGILILSEIIPKNLGVVHRKPLAIYLVYPLLLVRLLMKPFSLLAKKLLAPILRAPPPTEEEQEEEIRLLAERSAQTGLLSDSERDLIANALSLDDMPVHQLMTPRTVVTFLDQQLTVDDVCRDFKNIPFARLPIYRESIDGITGIVRRRDILQAYGEDRESARLADIKHEPLFVPETASGLQALQLFVKNHQQFAVVVDEYGSTVGVITMEDIVEHLIGQEIYEDSDPAVDMRELAKKRAERVPPASPDSPQI
jgi:CBS domain containing-hemolysin-like protein